MKLFLTLLGLLFILTSPIHALSKLDKYGICAQAGTLADQCFACIQDAADPQDV